MSRRGRPAWSRSTETRRVRSSSRVIRSCRQSDRISTSCTVRSRSCSTASAIRRRSDTVFENMAAVVMRCETGSSGCRSIVLADVRCGKREPYQSPARVLGGAANIAGAAFGVKRATDPPTSRRARRRRFLMAGRQCTLRSRDSQLFVPIHKTRELIVGKPVVMEPPNPDDVVSPVRSRAQDDNAP